MNLSNKRNKRWNVAGSHLFALACVTLPVVIGCKNLFSKAEIKAFRADAKDSWEYLIEKTTNLDGAPASAFSQSGLMPNVSSGTGSILAQSLDSIGVCYWYVKVPKSGPFDGGLKLDFDDGTPNIGIRNNLIARAGIPFTARALRLTDVLMAMNEAGGDLKKVQQGIVTSAVQTHEMLLNALAAGGVSVAAFSALTEPLRKQYLNFSAQAQARLAGNPPPSLLSIKPRTAPVTPNSFFDVKYDIMNLNNPSLRKAKDLLNSSGPKLSDDSWWRVITQVEKKSGRIQRIIYDEGTPTTYLIQTTARNGAKDLQRYGWVKTDKASLLRLGIDEDTLNPAKHLTGQVSNLKRMGLAIRQGGRGARNVATTAGKSVLDVGDSLIKTCTGGGLRIAVCSAVVGTVIAGSHMMYANTNQANDKRNEEQLNQKVTTVLSNPNLQQNFAAIMQELSKQTNISTELMEELRKRLQLKANESQLPGCNQSFGAEILSTPGVMDQGFGLPSAPETSGTGFATSYENSSQNSTSTVPSSTPTLAPALDTLPAASDSSLAGIPQFMPEDSGSSDLSSSSISTSGSTLPSVTPIVIPSDSQPSAPSTDPVSTDSSASGTDSTLPSAAPSSESSSGEVLQSDPFGPTP